MYNEEDEQEGVAVRSIGTCLVTGDVRSDKAEAAAAQKPLAIEEQGSFTVGGTL